MSRMVALAAMLCSAVSVHAQQVQPLLPDTAASRIVSFYNSERTTRFAGDARIAAGSTVHGDVAVLGGTLTIDGTVEGNVVVINGDLLLGDVARITGYAHVTGGTMRVFDPLVIGGGAVVYREPLRYRQDGDAIALVEVDVEPGVSAGRAFGFGRVDLLVASHGAYNRVEGMPIAIGPRVRFGGSHPTSARALLIARTANVERIEAGRFGYDLAAEQTVAPAAGFTVGARLFAEMAAIEALGLTDREAALATFFLHRDYRDHYEREGWSVFGRIARPGRPWQATLEYRDEEHLAQPSADPLTVLRNSEGWRPEASVAEGALRSVVLSARYDTRNEERDPSVGWLIQLELEQGLGGGIANPGLPDPDMPELDRQARSGFITTTFDVRRYARLSPYARLGVRILGAGSLDARPLPPQRQHVLGGAGSLPGYAPFAFECGARRTTVEIRGEPFHPYYGCDRVALVQLEYQAAFPFARRLAEAAGLSGSIGQLVRWVAFFDAGRAWNEPGSGDGRLGGNNDFSADAGIGLRLGPVGGYWAVPLTSGGGNVRFIVRLDPRI